MKIYFISLAILLMVATSVFAKEEITKVGYIDIEEVFTMLTYDSDVKKSLSKDIDNSKSKIEVLHKDIQSLKDKLDDDSLSEGRKIEIRNDIDFKEDELRKLVKEQENVVMEKEEEFSREILREVYKSIRSIAKRDGYAVILEKKEAGIIYGDSRFDITKEVIKYLKKQAKESDRR